jgi:hypothetical protein
MVAGWNVNRPGEHLNTGCSIQGPSMGADWPFWPEPSSLARPRRDSMTTDTWLASRPPTTNPRTTVDRHDKITTSVGFRGLRSWVSKPERTPRARIGRSLIDSSASSATDSMPS